MRRARARGFTLVEVAIVVVIVTILGGVGLVGYRRYRSAARLSEATAMVSTIRAAQAEHRGETGIYANVSAATTAFYPSPEPGPFKTVWGAPCATCIDPLAWEKLKVHAPNPVMYGYSTVAGIGGASLPVTSPAGSPDGFTGAPDISGSVGVAEPFYFIAAHGDTDGDGVACDVVANSESNQLVITNESE